jgi:predicted nucleotide-binding protein
MRRAKEYRGVMFSPEIIKEARDVMRGEFDKTARLRFRTMKIELAKEEWEYDDEEEFFAGYREPFQNARFKEEYTVGHLGVVVDGLGYRYGVSTKAEVEMATRGQILKIFNIFEANAERCRLPEETSEETIEEAVEPRIFIGHGHSNQWRDLKDHLHEKHGFEVKAYEIGARAGLSVKEVLEDMLTDSSFALLVFTGEDEDAEGKVHARENVIHESGLFQGSLGWRRAIILVEEGVEEFSNMEGLNTIRFGKNGIREAYGEVLATIKREFG